MNWPPPKELRDAYAAALEDTASNHYSLPRGRASLLEAVSDYMSPSFKLGRPLDPNSEVQITAGANEG